MIWEGASKGGNGPPKRSLVGLATGTTPDKGRRGGALRSDKGEG